MLSRIEVIQLVMFLWLVSTVLLLLYCNRSRDKKY
jgi:hypothetical protein